MVVSVFLWQPGDVARGRGHAVSNGWSVAVQQSQAMGISGFKNHIKLYV